MTRYPLIHILDADTGDTLDTVTGIAQADRLAFLDALIAELSARGVQRPEHAISLNLSDDVIAAPLDLLEAAIAVAESIAPVLRVIGRAA